MKVSTVVKRFTENFEKAAQRDSINKPISYALYQTWKWADTYEKPKNKKGGGI